MIIAVDVYYKNDTAKTAGVVFESWCDEFPISEYVTKNRDVKPYIPGQFYQRELPCIKKLLDEYKLLPEFIIIDGYVFLDGNTTPGLGKYLYDDLNGQVTIIGVAKTLYSGIDEQTALFRGDSKRPLYVTSIGIANDLAKKYISSMYGLNRIPVMLKRADQLCRGIN